MARPSPEQLFFLRQRMHDAVRPPRARREVRNVKDAAFVAGLRVGDPKLFSCSLGLGLWDEFSADGLVLRHFPIGTTDAEITAALAEQRQRDCRLADLLAYALAHAEELHLDLGPVMVRTIIAKPPAGMPFAPAIGLRKGKPTLQFCRYDPTRPENKWMFNSALDTMWRVVVRPLS